MHTAEYLRKRTIVRWLFWTPITLAAFAWCVSGFLQTIA